MLRDFRVLDLTDERGFLAGKILGDLGANVVKVEAPGGSEHEKCVRCWHHREDVGMNQEHPELCKRCVSNVTGDGEIRHYA